MQLTNSSKANYSATLCGSSDALAITELALNHQGLLVVVVADTPEAHRLRLEIQFFSEQQFPILSLPDWETLPYDLFSPHQDIISNRLLTLYQLPSATNGGSRQTANTASYTKLLAISMTNINIRA